jgi:predicted NBD/HSP70 family sugar kinase
MRIMSEHLDERSWQNFATLQIGTGVGVGIVLNGQLRFGLHGWAGELGHIDLGVSNAIRVAFGESDEADFLAQTCTCGHPGYHFESLVNYKGLSSLARRIGQAMKTDPITEGRDYCEIVSALNDQKSAWSDDRIMREVWPTLISAPGQTTALPLRLKCANWRDRERARATSSGLAKPMRVCS